jgi:hypothetical protein
MTKHERKLEVLANKLCCILDDLEYCEGASAEITRVALDGVNIHTEGALKKLHEYYTSEEYTHNLSSHIPLNTSVRLSRVGASVTIKFSSREEAINYCSDVERELPRRSA